MTCIQYKQFKERFKTIGKIGSGNCASVIKIQDNKTKLTYALKCAKFDAADKLASAFQQIQVVRSINHPAAIQIEYYFVKCNTGQSFINHSITQLGMIMELGDRNLEQDIFMRKNKQKYYSLDEIQQLANTLIGFFAAMQIRGYLHRDIKPENILIMEPPKLSGQAPNLSFSRCNTPKYKVCDFGFAVKLHQFSDKNIAGTASYASPKIQNKFKNSQIFVSGNNYKDDVYSLGVTLLQVCILASVDKMPINKSLQIISNRYGYKFAELISCMLQISQQKRPNFTSLEHIFEQYLQIKNKNLNNNSNQISIVNKNSNVNLSLNKNSNLYGTTQNNLDNRFKQKADRNYYKTFQQSTSDSQNYNNVKQHKLYPSANTNAQNFLGKISEKQKQQQIKVQQQNEDYNKILKQIYPSQLQTPNKLPQPKQKINKTLQKQKNSNELYLFQSIEGKDKAKTKRRSKTFANNKQTNLSYNQYLKQQKNKKQGQKQIGDAKNILAIPPIKQQSKNQISFISSKQEDKINNKSQQNVKTLYKFQDESQIRFTQIIQLPQQSAEISMKYSPIIACLIAKNHLYILCQDLMKSAKLITQIKLQNPLSNPKFMQYNKKLTRLIIANGNNLIMTLNIENILQIISQNINRGSRRTSIDAKYLDLIQYKNQKVNESVQMTALYVSQDSYDMYKGLSNGQLYENGKFIFANGNKGKINYIRKNGDLIYVANYQGLLKCYSDRLYEQVGQRRLMGYYQCKNTLVGLDFIKINNSFVLSAVLAIGVVLYFDKNLKLLDMKNITQVKQCLKAHCFNPQQKQGKKLLTINAQGSIYNQFGTLIVQTKLQQADRLFLVEKGNKIIVVVQNGSIFEVKLKNQQQNQKFFQSKSHYQYGEQRKINQTQKKQQFFKLQMKSKYSLFK